MINFEKVRRLISEGLQKLPRANVDGWIETRWLYADRVVYQRNARDYQRTWSIDDQLNLTFGPEVEVTESWTPVTAAVLTEAVDSDGAPAKDRFKVVVIREGISLNNVNYPAAVLRESVSKFAKARVFAQSDSDHTKGVRDTRQLVGWLEDPQFVESARGGEIVATLVAIEATGWAARFSEAVTKGNPDVYGFSINASGKDRRHTGGRECVAIAAVRSVDVVVDPSAGGSLVGFTESTHEASNMRTALLQKLALINAALAATFTESHSDDQILAAYTEAVAGNTPPAPVPTPAATNFDAQFAEAEARSQRRIEARATVAASGLPPLAQQRVIATLTDFSEAAVNAAIGNERAYLQQLSPGPQIALAGSVVAGVDWADNQFTRLCSFFAGTDTMQSFREAYEEITGDRGVSGQMAECDEVRLQQVARAVNAFLQKQPVAPGKRPARFSEAVTTATMPNILGAAMQGAVLDAYVNDTDWNDLDWLVTETPLRDFTNSKVTRHGGYGNLAVVAENADYQPMTTPADAGETYAAAKRGGIETLSREAILRDDVALISRIPIEMGIAAARTRYQFVWALLTASNVLADGNEVFHSSRGNLGTTALSAAAFLARYTAMLSRTVGGVIRPYTPSVIAVPIGLHSVAFDLFVRGVNLDPTYVQSRNPVIKVIQGATDQTDWFLFANKRQSNLVQLGYINGERNPQVLLANNPTAGSMFTKDAMQYRIRHEYGGQVAQPAAMDKSVVA